MENIFSAFLIWVLVLAALMAYFVIVPAVTVIPSFVLSGIILAVLTASVYMHYSQFSTEYRLSTWQNNFKFYSSFTMLGLILIFSVGFYSYNTNPAVASQINSASSRVTNIARSAGNSVGNTFGGVTNAVNGLTRGNYDSY